MPRVCFYFQVHQPYRLKRFSLLTRHDGSPYHEYFDMDLTYSILRKVAQKCYYPMNSLLLSLIKTYDIKVSFSITGVFLEQAQVAEPGIIESFQRLAETGNVEFLAETYFHSLSSLYTHKKEFFTQVDMHQKLIRSLFGKTPTVFRNTEALYNNEIGAMVENMGMEGIITEGITYDPHYIYTRPGGALRILMRDYRLSDDIAYRFSDKNWSGYPLTPEKYARAIATTQGDTVNLFMDYETFGEHHWADTGIFDFFAQLPRVFREHHIEWCLPHELCTLTPHGAADFQNSISWADTDRDTSAWLGNEMQRDCFEIIQLMESHVVRKKQEHVWRLLQSSDHLYYMCTKEDENDFEVHSYFSPYPGGPYDAYVNYRAILDDFMQKLYG